MPEIVGVDNKFQKAIELKLVCRSSLMQLLGCRRWCNKCSPLLIKSLTICRLISNQFNQNLLKLLESAFFSRLRCFSPQIKVIIFEVCFNSAKLVGLEAVSGLKNFWFLKCCAFIRWLATIDCINFDVENSTQHNIYIQVIKFKNGMRRINKSSITWNIFSLYLYNILRL